MYDGKKRSDCEKGETVEGEIVQREVAMFSGMPDRNNILPVGKERKRIGKAKMKGREEEKTGCKNRMRRREISDRHMKKRSFILSMINASQKIGTEKTRSRRSAPFDRACFAAGGGETENEEKKE